MHYDLLEDLIYPNSKVLVMKNFSCIIFDLGGVLVNWHNSWLIDELCQRFRLSKKNLTEEFENNIVSLSTGKINEIEFWHLIGRKIDSYHLENLKDSLYDDIFRRLISINDSVYLLTKKLKEKGMTLGILSNTEQVTFSIVNEIMPLNHFEYKFLSYKIGYAKPDKRIYQHVVENLPFNKEKLLFIDDLYSNVESAKTLGIDSFQFLSVENLIQQLRNKNIL